jgi:hypothetical protein
MPSSLGRLALAALVTTAACTPAERRECRALEASLLVSPDVSEPHPGYSGLKLRRRYVNLTRVGDYGPHFTVEYSCGPETVDAVTPRNERRSAVPHFGARTR